MPQVLSFPRTWERRRWQGDTEEERKVSGPPARWPVSPGGGCQACDLLMRLGTGQTPTTGGQQEQP